MATLSTPELNRRFIDALGDLVVGVNDPDAAILSLTCSPPLPAHLRVYIFNATNPPGGRTTPEHKIQLMVPGQKRDERGNFDFSGDHAVLMVGYADEHDAFVLWDAELHRDFSFSKNAQVRTETVETAIDRYAIATQERTLPLRGRETVIAAPSGLLGDAIILRFDGPPAGNVVHKAPETATTTGGPSGGKTYEPPPRKDESEETPESRVFEVDPNLVDRGTAAHKDIQDALAEAIKRRDLEPLSPLQGDPQFDIAWIDEDVAFVAEVKSLTEANEERQLRLGLGQVLSYVHLLDWPSVRAVRGVLAVERQPTADYWSTLCAEHDVALSWPEAYDELFN